MHERDSILAPRLFGWIFWVGMTVFLISIGIAACLYPGGNRFDAEFPRFSLTGNFICDLFDRDGYNKMPNSGRPFAVVSAYAFAVSLLPFWWSLPKLFPDYPKHGRFVRIFGCVAMVASLFIATPLHDWCINIAVPSAILAFIGSAHALLKSGERMLAGLGFASLAICLINYLSLIFRYFPGTLPGLQKITLLAFLVWVTASAPRILLAPIPGIGRHSKTSIESPGKIAK